MVAVAGYSLIALAIVSGAANHDTALLLLGVDTLALVLLATNAWNLRSRVPLFSSRSRVKVAGGWAILLMVWVGAFGTVVTTTLPAPVKFVVTALNPSPCALSTDETYGYTQANPIRVGGGDLGAFTGARGPERERAYLDNLRSPNGEQITYGRIGSFPFEGTILDAYKIKGLTKVATLYIDQYTYTEPKAPTRFTCASAFPLTKP